MEDQEATIETNAADKVTLAAEVSKLETQIASLKKAILEASMLRNEEKENNEVTVRDAKAGKKAVDEATKVLSDFYGDNAFLQKGPNRDGKDFKKEAPELSYDGDYKGKQEASKGIIGILEMISADFERTISETEGAEKSAQGDFEEFEKTAKDDIKDKDKLKGEKEDAIKKASGAITDAEDAHSDAKKLMETAIEELEALKVSCFFGESSFAEKKKQMEDEIKALKKAKKILEDWK